MLRLTFLEAKNYLTLATPSPVSQFWKTILRLRKKLRGSCSIRAPKWPQKLLQKTPKKVSNTRVLIWTSILPVHVINKCLGLVKQVRLHTVRPAQSSPLCRFHWDLHSVVKWVHQCNCHAVTSLHVCMVHGDAFWMMSHICFAVWMHLWKLSRRCLI